MFTIQRDGLKLQCCLEKPTVPASRIVIMMHGFGGQMSTEPNDLYQMLTKRLLEQGMAVLRFDFNGHGQSDGAFEDMNVLNELQDAVKIIEYARSLDFVKEIVLIGHSQGGVVSGMAAGLYADIIYKLVLLAPAATLKDDAIHGECFGTRYDTSHIPQTVNVNDKKIGGHYFRIAKNLPIFELTGAFKGDTLVIHGKEDEVVDVSITQGYQNALENCTVNIYEHLDHGIEGSDKDTVIDSIVDFIKD